DAAREHRAQRAKRLRHDRGVVAEGRRRDAGADHHPPRAGAERAEPGERVRRMAVGMLPWLEMVADEHRVETDLFGQARKIQEFARSELLGRGLVSEFQHLSLLQRSRRKKFNASPRRTR